MKTEQNLLYLLAFTGSEHLGTQRSYKDRIRKDNIILAFGCAFPEYMYLFSF